MADLRLWLIPLIFYNVLYFGLCLPRNTPKCPLQCTCEKSLNVRKVSCNNQRIVNVDLGVPKNVESYDLSENSIKELENFAFKNMALDFLIDLNLSKNSISWIALHAFVGLRKLRVLNLSHNRLEQGFLSDHFSDNLQLESLHLVGNKFLHLPDKPFVEHKNLKILDLSSCHIEYLPDKVFSGLPNLKVLDLSRNDMTVLEVASLSQLKLTHIFLDNNHWNCDEKFYNLQEWLTTEKMIHQTMCSRVDKMFEKLQIQEDSSAENTELTSAEELDRSWYSEEEEQNIEVVQTHDFSLSNMSFIARFNHKFPSAWSLVLGFQVGLLVGVFLSYCWLSEMCKCKISRSRRRRNARRIHYSRSNASRNGLLLHNDIVAAAETPPVVRRQNSQSGVFCRSTSWEAFPSRQTVSNIAPSPSVSETQNSAPPPLTTLRSETPPPAYQDCLHDSFITS